MPTEGSSTCMPCIPGETNQEVGTPFCDLCPKNFMSPTKMWSKPCIPCPQGRKSDPGSAKCSACFAGKFVVGLECHLCPSGWAQDNQNQKECIECGANGMRASSSSEGSPNCQLCDLGKYGNGIVPGCFDCYPGKYNDGKGEFLCKDCPKDTYSGALTATSNAQCKTCGDQRTTGVSVGIKNFTGCLCKRKIYYQNSSDACLTCPPGADCSRKDGIPIGEIVALTGYWRPEAMSTEFSDCAEGYKGMNRRELAELRCCPVGLCNGTNGTNGNMQLRNLTDKINVMFDHPDEQCAHGYAGTLCLACAKDYVHIGLNCEYCKGGSQFTHALLSVAGFSVFVGIGIFFFLICKKAAKNAEHGNSMVTHIKQLIGFLQILASQAIVYDSVPWSRRFLEFSFGISIFNFDVMSIFSQHETCTLAIPFLEQFVLHMTLPGFLLVSMILAQVAAEHVMKVKKHKVKALKRTRSTVVKLKRLNHSRHQVFKFFILGMTLLYPGLSTRIFTVWRCKSIIGMEGLLLEADMSVKCYSFQHLAASTLAIVFLIAYVIGVPAVILFLLWYNRRSLHDEKSKKHERIQFALGGMYEPYKPKLYFFEVIVIIHKCVMTGSMVIVSPGSSLQLLVASLVMLAYLLILVRFAPFEDRLQNWSSYCSNLALLMTLLGGFALITDDPESPTYEKEQLSDLLIGINVVCIVINMMIMFVDTFSSTIEKCMKCCCHVDKKDEKEDKDTTKVQPMKEKEVDDRRIGPIRLNESE